MNSLTIAYVTSRKEPHCDWFLNSLAKQILGKWNIRIIIVDHYLEPQSVMGVEDFDRRRKLVPFMSDGLSKEIARHCSVLHIHPKPSIWKGPHRITREDWWSKSNDMNSAICLCETEWLAIVDDRSVLCPGWLDCIEEAMRGQYAVVGTYEKHARMKVENGEIIYPGETLGIDHRPQNVAPMPTHDWYGGHCALPLEWCLRVNGFSEDVCDSLGLEDAMFGVTLRNFGFPMVYDSRMKIIEDRTPGEIDGALKRADKGVSPNDKSHKIVEIFRDKTDSQNSFDIRNLRDRVLSGEPFPPPSASHLDWYDGQPISEMI